MREGESTRPQPQLLGIVGRLQVLENPVVFEMACLEVSRKTQGNVARRADGVSGEETVEVDDVQNIVEVLSVNLKLHDHTIRPVDNRARGRVDLERRIDAFRAKLSRAITCWPY
jgi:hypothetical protein